MEAINATVIEKNFFGYLKNADKWQPVFTQKKKSASEHNSDWRDKMTITPKLLVPAEEAFAPMDDIWEK